MNTITINITNCLDCSNCYTNKIYTADPFEHETGAYCSKVNDTDTNGFGKNGKHKLINFDDWDLRKYTQIPNWCPLLELNNKGD